MVHPIILVLLLVIFFIIFVNINFAADNQIRKIPTVKMPPLDRSMLKQIFAAVAQQLDLKFPQKTLFDRSLKISGTIKDHTIELSLKKEAGKKYIQARYTYDNINDKYWKINKETLSSLQQQLSGNKDIQVGDTAFDQIFDLWELEQEELISILNQELRSHLLDLNTKYVFKEINENDIIMFMPIDSDTYTPFIINLVNHIIHTADLIKMEPDMKKRLIYNCVNDQNARFRELNLKKLWELFPDDTDTISIVRKAMQDNDPDVQIWAAIKSGEYGLAFLLELVQQKILLTNDFYTIAEHFGHMKYKPAINILKKYYEKTGAIGEQIAMVEAIAAIDQTVAIPFIREKLAETDFFELQSVCIKTLGEIGSIEEIEFLNLLVSEMTNNNLKNTISQAVRSIQLRNGIKADLGWLSLTESPETEGGLSLADGEDGGLSVIEKE